MKDSLIKPVIRQSTVVQSKDRNFEEFARDWVDNKPENFFLRQDSCLIQLKRWDVYFSVPIWTLPSNSMQLTKTIVILQKVLRQRYLS